MTSVQMEWLLRQLMIRRLNFRTWSWHDWMKWLIVHVGSCRYFTMVNLKSCLMHPLHCVKQVCICTLNWLVFCNSLKIHLRFAWIRWLLVSVGFLPAKTCSCQAQGLNCLKVERSRMLYTLQWYLLSQDNEISSVSYKTNTNTPAHAQSHQLLLKCAPTRMKTVYLWWNDRIIKVDIVEHNSQNKMCKSCFDCLTYAYINPGWLLNK